jgi:hypothetical protein
MVWPCTPWKAGWFIGLTAFVATLTYLQMQHNTLGFMRDFFFLDSVWWLIYLSAIDPSLILIATGYASYQIDRDTLPDVLPDKDAVRPTRILPSPAPQRSPRHKPAIAVDDEKLDSPIAASIQGSGRGMGVGVMRQTSPSLVVKAADSDGDMKAVASPVMSAASHGRHASRRLTHSASGRNLGFGSALSPPGSVAEPLPLDAVNPIKAKTLPKQKGLHRQRSFVRRLAPDENVDSVRDILVAAEPRVNNRPVPGSVRERVAAVMPVYIPKKSTPAQVRAALSSLKEVVASYLYHFKPEAIYLVNNAPGGPLVDLRRYFREEVAAGRLPAEWLKINILPHDEGNKSEAQYVGTVAAMRAGYKFIFTADDDVVLPKELGLDRDMEFLVPKTDDVGRKSTIYDGVAHAIRPVGRTPKRNLSYWQGFWQSILLAMQRIEYLLSALNKLMEMTFAGGVLAPHGAIFLSRADKLRDSLEQHSRIFHGEDWQNGVYYLSKRLRIAFSDSVVVPTFAPTTFLELLWQRVTSWDMTPYINPWSLVFKPFAYRRGDLGQTLMMKLVQFYTIHSFIANLIRVPLFIAVAPKENFWPKFAVYFALTAAPVIAWNQFKLKKTHPHLANKWWAMALFPFYKLLTQGFALLGLLRALLVWWPNMKENKTVLKRRRDGELNMAALLSQLDPHPGFGPDLEAGEGVGHGRLPGVPGEQKPGIPSGSLTGSAFSLGSGGSRRGREAWSLRAHSTSSQGGHSGSGGFGSGGSLSTEGSRRSRHSALASSRLSVLSQGSSHRSLTPPPRLVEPPRLPAERVNRAHEWYVMSGRNTERQRLARQQMEREDVRPGRLPVTPPVPPEAVRAMRERAAQLGLSPRGSVPRVASWVPGVGGRMVVEELTEGSPQTVDSGHSSPRR